MKIGLYLKDYSLLDNEELQDMIREFTALGICIYYFDDTKKCENDVNMVLSVGGDGTFLSASEKVAEAGIPVLGVNLGRIGFLSENSVLAVKEAVRTGDFTVEDRDLLMTSVSGRRLPDGFCPYSLNEICIHRKSASLLGITVSLDGTFLPTYWADGLIIATSSGSTAYSLSAGGPLCMPGAEVLLIVPIAPHNLNVRPLVIPNKSSVEITVTSREPEVILTMDNRTMEINRTDRIKVKLAPFKLKRVKLKSSSFVNALTGKLYWGEDIRNNKKS